MGNAMKTCRSKERRIRLMKADGEVMKIEGPVCVKEIIGKYPDHAIYNARTLRLGLGLGRPLPQNAELQASQLYYLVPLPQGHMDSAISIDCVSSSSVHRTECEPGSDGRVLRVKLRMSKQELASLLSRCPLTKAPDARICCNKNLIGWKPTLSTISELNTLASPDV